MLTKVKDFSSIRSKARDFLRIEYIEVQWFEKEMLNND